MAGQEEYKEEESLNQQNPSLELELIVALYNANKELLNAKKSKKGQEEDMRKYEGRILYFQQRLNQIDHSPLDNRRVDQKTQLKQELGRGILAAQEMLLLLANHEERPRKTKKERNAIAEELTLKIEYYKQEWQQIDAGKLPKEQTLKALLRTRKQENAQDYYNLQRDGHDHSTEESFFALNSFFRNEEVRLDEEETLGLKEELQSELRTAQETQETKIPSKEEAAALKKRIAFYTGELEQLEHSPRKEKCLKDLVSSRWYEMQSEYDEIKGEHNDLKKFQKRLVRYKKIKKSLWSKIPCLNSCIRYDARHQKKRLEYLVSNTWYKLQLDDEKINNSSLWNKIPLLRSFMNHDSIRQELKQREAYLKQLSGMMAFLKEEKARLAQASAVEFDTEECKLHTEIQLMGVNKLSIPRAKRIQEEVSRPMAQALIGGDQIPINYRGDRRVSPMVI